VVIELPFERKESHAAVLCAPDLTDEASPLPAPVAVVEAPDPAALAVASDDRVVQQPGSPTELLQASVGWRASVGLKSALLALSLKPALISANVAAVLAVAVVAALASSAVAPKSTDRRSRKTYRMRFPSRIRRRYRSAHSVPRPVSARQTPPSPPPSPPAPEHISMAEGPSPGSLRRSTQDLHTVPFEMPYPPPDVGLFTSPVGVGAIESDCLTAPRDITLDIETSYTATRNMESSSVTVPRLIAAVLSPPRPKRAVSTLSPAPGAAGSAFALPKAAGREYSRPPSPMASARTPSPAAAARWAVRGARAPRP